MKAMIIKQAKLNEISKNKSSKSLEEILAKKAAVLNNILSRANLSDNDSLQKSLQ